MALKKNAAVGAAVRMVNAEEWVRMPRLSPRCGDANRICPGCKAVTSGDTYCRDCRPVYPFSPSHEEMVLLSARGQDTLLKRSAAEASERANAVFLSRIIRKSGLVPHPKSKASSPYPFIAWFASGLTAIAVLAAFPSLGEWIIELMVQ